MKKTVLFAAILMCAILMLFAAGCSNEKVDIAFITSLDTSDSNSPAANCLSGVADYAASNKLSYEEYNGNSGKMIKQAAEDGARVIVLFGVEDENEVYNCAAKSPDLKFICLDFGNDFMVRSNICCVNVSQIHCGVYAGYSAVKEGNLILGIQGEETAETYNYIKGFVEGAQIAAVEIGVSKKPVTIYYNISGSDMAAERVASWYDNGCKLVFCSEETYGAVTEYVTDSDIHKVMTFGADRTNEEDVIASAYSDYRSVVGEYLKYAFSGSFTGGMMFTVGAADKASGFSYDHTAFEVLTASDLTVLTETISNSDLTDSSSYKTPSDKGYSKIVLEEAGIISQSE